MKKLMYRIFKPWKVRRTTFPYDEGYCAFNRWTKTAIDFMPTREQAQQSCDELNFLTQ